MGNQIGFTKRRNLGESSMHKVIGFSILNSRLNRYTGTGKDALIPKIRMEL